MAKKTFYILVTLFLTAMNGTVIAAPEGGNIVDGSGSIDKQGNKTTVTQNSQNLVVDWDSFNVGKTEHVHFEQQHTTDSALNRIYDSRPSEIWGQLTGKGNIWLLNPNGVIFSKTAKVSTGGLVAAGLWMDSQDFMSGRYVLNNSRGTGDVSNAGVMEAKNIGLAGANIANSGTIRAKAGRVSLASGERITVDFAGDGLMQFITDSIPEGTSIDHSGSIEAGEVSLSIGTANDIYGGVINTTGVITATGANDAGGAIDLVAAEINQSDGSINTDGTAGGEVTITANSKVTLGGSISARGNGGLSTEQSSGGSIRATADSTEVTATASIDASGETGGGEVLLGGGWQGKDDSIRNAQNTEVQQGASIKANALGAGDGGTIVVWSDNTTTFYGAIEARGGEVSGNGGAAEVSGNTHLLMRGTADLTAANGDTGHLLLDPGTVRICDGAAAGCANSGRNTFTDNGIQTMLGSANVTIATSNASGGAEDINVDSGVSIFWRANTLSLNAGNNINLGGILNASGGGTLALTFGNMLSLGSATLSGNITATGDGSSTLVGPGSTGDDVAWTINGVNNVTVNGVVMTLLRVNRLQGGTGIDTFDVRSTHVGSLDGGGGGDTFNLYPGSYVTGGITGGAGGDTFNLYSGSYAAGGITSGAGSDTFNFRGGGVNGTVDGGSGDDTMTFRNTGAQTIALTMVDADGFSGSVRSDSLSMLAGINNIDGNPDTNDVLIGMDVSSTWILDVSDGASSSYQGDRGEVLTFSGFYNIYGGIMDDYFTISGSGGSRDVLPWGNISGGAGENRFDFTAGADVNITGTIYGGEDRDIFNFYNGTSVSVSRDIYGYGENDSFNFHTDASVTGGIYGGGENDNFYFRGNGISVPDGIYSEWGHDNFYFMENGTSVVGLISGGADTDSFDFAPGSPPGAGITDDLAVVLSSTNGYHEGLSGSVSGGVAVSRFTGINKITGGSGIDSLTGVDSVAIPNYWILGTTSGTYGNNLEFSSIENIHGVSGTDSLDMSGIGTDLAVSFSGTPNVTGYSGSVSGGATISFTGINKITGGGGTDSLTGLDAVSTWILGTRSNSYSSNNHNLVFSSIENIHGGSMADSLDMSGMTTDLAVSLSGTPNVTGYSGSISGGTTVSNFTGINKITGGSGTDSLTGLDVLSCWFLGWTDNTDSYISNNQLLEFSSIEIFNAGTAADHFSIERAYTGNLDGGGGDDSFDIRHGGSVIGDITGGSGNDSFVFHGGRVTGTVSGGADSDTLSFAGIIDAVQNSSVRH